MLHVALQIGLPFEKENNLSIPSMEMFAANNQKDNRMKANQCY